MVNTKYREETHNKSVMCTFFHFKFFAFVRNLVDSCWVNVSQPCHMLCSGTLGSANILPRRLSALG